MASKKKTNRKKLPAGPARRPDSQLRKSVESSRMAQRKETTPIRRPKAEVPKINKALRKLRGPRYSLNKKIKAAPSPYYRRKYKKELAAFEASIREKESLLVQRRDSARELIRERESVLRYKKKVSDKIDQTKKKLQKAKKKKDLKAVAKLALELSAQKIEAAKIKEALGSRSKLKEPADSPTEEKAPDGYLADPNNPYTYWQGVRQFDDDVKSTRWDWFIVDGKRMSGKNSIQVSATGHLYFSQHSADSDTGIYRYMNLESNSVKYTIQQL